METDTGEKEGGKRERRQVEEKCKRESDDVTLYNTMTLIKGAHTNTPIGCTGVQV